MNKRIVTFVVVLALLSLLSAGIFRLCGGEYLSVEGTLFASFYMFIPMISVLLTRVCFHDPLSLVFGDISWKINRWWLVAWLGMPLLVGLILLVNAMLPHHSLSTDNEMFAASIAQMSASLPEGVTMTAPLFLLIIVVSGLMAGCTVNALFAFGEEIAWRDFLVKELKDCSFWKQSLIIGSLWGVWHAPLILMGHNYPDHPVLGVFLMVIFCISFTPIMLYIRKRSDSVIAAAVAHGTLNAFSGLTVIVTNYVDIVNSPCGVVGIVSILLVVIIGKFCIKNK